LALFQGSLNEWFIDIWVHSISRCVDLEAKRETLMVRL